MVTDEMSSQRMKSKTNNESAQKEGKWTPTHELDNAKIEQNLQESI